MPKLFQIAAEFLLAPFQLKREFSKIDVELLKLREEIGELKTLVDETRKGMSEAEALAAELNVDARDLLLRTLMKRDAAGNRPTFH